MEKVSSVLHVEAPRATPSIASSAFKADSRILNNMSFDAMEGVYNLEKKFPEMRGLDNKAKREFVLEKRGEMIREIAMGNRNIKARGDRLAVLEARNDAIKDVFEWSAESGLALEKPEGPSFRKMRKAVAEGKTAYLGKDMEAETPAHDFEKEVFRFAEIVVIEHNWAAAFAGANVGDAVVKLPYDVCAFEFKFAGRPVIALATQIDTDIAFCPVILAGDLWVIPDFIVPLSGYSEPDDSRNSFIELLTEIGEQIRGACIALDADVATSSAVREPYAGVPGRNVHQQLKPYHVISLARRAARPLQPSSGVDSGRRVRLHFRRGHWRHFEDHKTWIKWMLVGDPDLGFVEKHYRL